jgi:transcriptional regulator with XRE-family HTH domain
MVRIPTEQDAPHVRLLLAIRTQRNWSQAQLAQHLSLHVNTIANWERGLADPHPMWLQVLRSLLT